MWKAVPTCFTFERQEIARALARAWAKTGKRIAAKMAMIAMTTSNSMRVNPRLEWRTRVKMCMVCSPCARETRVFSLDNGKGDDQRPGHDNACGLTGA